MNRRLVVLSICMAAALAVSCGDDEQGPSGPGTAPETSTLTAVSGSTDAIYLTWTSCGSSDFTEYRIYRSLTTGIQANPDQATIIQIVTSSSDTTLTDSGLGWNTTYYYAEGTYYTKGDQDGKAGYVVAEDPNPPPTETLPSAQADAPDPFQVLRQAADWVAATKQCTLTARTTSDQILDSGQKVQVTAERTLYVQKPNKVAVEYRSAQERRRVLLDGKTLTLFSPTKNTYGREAMPGTIKAALDKLANEYGMVMPLGELLVSDYDRLAANIQTGQYIGQSTVGLYPCDHLAFTQESLDWEIWLERGAKPVPRKIVITYKLLDGAPRHETVITRWDDSAPPKSAFTLDIPAGAVKADMLPAPAAAE